MSDRRRSDYQKKDLSDTNNYSEDDEKTLASFQSPALQPPSKKKLIDSDNSVLSNNAYIPNAAMGCVREMDSGFIQVNKSIKVSNQQLSFSSQKNLDSSNNQSRNISNSMIIKEDKESLGSESPIKKPFISTFGLSNPLISQVLSAQKGSGSSSSSSNRGGGGGDGSISITSNIISGSTNSFNISNSISTSSSTSSSSDVSSDGSGISFFANNNNGINDGINIISGINRDDSFMQSHELPRTISQQSSPGNLSSNSSSKKRQPLVPLAHSVNKNNTTTQTSSSNFIPESVKREVYNQRTAYRPGMTVIEAELDPDFLWVNPSQRDNPIMSKITQVRYCYAPSIIPDFQISSSGCILFLSLKFHQRNPDYIEERIKTIKGFMTRILLVCVDLDQPESLLLSLNVVCVFLGVTLVLAFTQDEVVQYLMIYKKNANSAADYLKKRPKDDHLGQLTQCLTCIRTISSSNVRDLVNKFGSLKNILQTSAESLILVPGLGYRKTQKLLNVFHQPIVPSDEKSKPKNINLTSFLKPIRPGSTTTKNFE